jgi:hypothetical protein
MSADVLMTGVYLSPSVTDALGNNGKHDLGPRNEIRGLRLESFRHWKVEDTPVVQDKPLDRNSRCLLGVVAYLQYNLWAGFTLENGAVDFV